MSGSARCSNRGIPRDAAWQWAGLLLLGMLIIPLLRSPLTFPVCLLLGAASVILLFWQRGRCLFAVPLGMLLMSVDASQVVAQKLDPRLVGVDVAMLARIVEFPERGGAMTRLLVAPLASTPLPLTRLSWYDAPPMLRLGECWQLTVRLRRPRGWSNPDGFDYEKWLFLQRIGATGYVKSGAQVSDCSDGSRVQRVRARIADRLTSLLPADDATAVLLAITIGARHQIDAEQWQRYAQTGTSHLMAISGMHIGLAAGSSYLLIWLLSASIRRRGNHRVLASIVSLLVAAAYVLLSGFAIPARRALIMLLLAVLTLLLRRRINALHVVSLTIICLSLAAPLNVLAPGFQLSFAAVGILWLQAQRLKAGTAPNWRQRPLQAVRQLSVLQLGLLLGLLPLTVLSFDRAAWLAPAVNLAVLPIFNFATVPAALAGVVLDGVGQPLGDVLLRLAWRSTGLILTVVDMAAALPRANLMIAPPRGLMLGALSLATVWVWLPPGWPGRRIAWVAAVAAVLQQPERPPAGCADLHVLDVGQGLASVVVTANHVLVFDTGPAFRSGSNTASLVISPFLRSIAAEAIDLLVVSHGDLDHAGGFKALQSEWPITALLYGEPLPASENRGWPCQAGQTWSWDGVLFRVLHPLSPGQTGNNASCVLELRSGDRRLLLTGDIEARAERQMLAAEVLAKSEFVQIPHHGSETSSSGAFIEAVLPQVAVASTGFGNRWDMPRAKVVARWRAAGAQTYNTATDGAVSVRLCPGAALKRPETARSARRNVWQEPR